MVKDYGAVSAAPAKPKGIGRANISGIIIGALSTLAAGVIINKVAKVNITSAATGLVDTGIDKIKGITKKEESSE
jgi:hypothetical protein